MEYNQQPDGSTELTQKNVDTGMGLERILTILNEKVNIYETELFLPVMNVLEKKLTEQNTELSIKDKRIICEHTRAVCFLLGDPQKISPSNTEQGYILRRFIRRIIRLLNKAGMDETILCELAQVIINQYQDVYPELNENAVFIVDELNKEYMLFKKTLVQGLKKAERYFVNLGQERILSGELAFKLYDTYGFPIELTMDLANEKKCIVDVEAFKEKFKEHQEKSRQGSQGKYQGGLADHSEQTTKLHTATNLLNGALRKVLGDTIFQRGCNITPVRLRFDFSFERKITIEELDKVSKIVNEAIVGKIDVLEEEMTVEEAHAAGAIGIFDSKYKEQVKVYTIPGYSKEICGGPHVKNTGEIGSFQIIKEESSSAGVRRIKAVII